MNGSLLIVPVVVPLVAAAVATVARTQVPVRRFVTIGSVTGALAAAIAILVRVEADGPFVTQLGDWPAPLAITLVADLFSALMLVVGLATVLTVLVFAVGQGSDVDGNGVFHPVFLVMVAGVSLSFLTGDLFDLFVAFELTLASSYVLITLGARRDQVRSGMTYVVINLVASAMFVATIAFIYAATGTVNLADLAGKLQDVDPGLRTALAVLLLVVFGTKAAIFPLFNWLPDAYPTARTPVTAVFAGLLTKVGVYAIVRTQTLLFPADRPSTLLLVVAGLTMIVGVLGAIAQDDMKRILSFHIVSQIGYMILGVGLATVAGVAGTVLFLVHQIPVKASLFLVGGLVEHSAGSTKLSRVGGLARRTPFPAVLFGLAALSLAGIPPLSGFIGKLAIIDAGLSAKEYAIVGVALLGSLLTLFSMVKIWNGVFLGVAEEPTLLMAEGSLRPAAPLMRFAAGGLVALTIAIAVFAAPLYRLSERAADTLVTRDAYIEAVLR
jgi:multicomponent Na+:H+ antiporter subunit D